MRVRYIYSACVVIETPDARILTDPWFTPGAYDGAWFQYPVLPDPVEAIGPVDAIYISHIHPDHYDPVFLRRYLARYPETRLLIGQIEPPHLRNKMKLDGFEPEIVDRLAIGGTELTIVANQAQGGREVAVDTALAVRRGKFSVVNLNDNPFDPRQVSRLQAFLPHGRPDFALLPYSGAGPFPQTFSFANEAAQLEAGEQKKRQFFAQMGRYIEAFKPVRVMPFAGKYWLGGKLARLNPYRGVPDPVEAAGQFPDLAFVLADGGAAYYDLETGTVSAARTETYDMAAVNAHLVAFAENTASYEREIRPEPGRNFPFFPLLTAAKRAARSRLRLNEFFWLVLKPDGIEKCFLLNGGDDTPVQDAVIASPRVADLFPRIEISIHPRYLFGLLTRLYHWNNALVGSQYFSHRVPNIYRPAFYEFLEMLHV